MRGARFRSVLLLVAVVAFVIVAGGSAVFFMFPRYLVIEDLPCGAEHCLVDIYRPKTSRASLPVIVFFHGGGWQTGNRKGQRLVLVGLARQGYVAASASYRLFPAASYPVFLEDAAQAVRWVRKHAPEWGGDPDRLYLAGFSAGAHIAAMLAFDQRWLEGVGIDPSRDVAGLIGLAGPYIRFPTQVPNLTAIFGDAEQQADALPARHADGRDPSALLLAGELDAEVPAKEAADFAALIESRGGRAEARIYPGIDHNGLAWAFSFRRSLITPALRDVAAFIERSR